jgi:hypothetical protein
MANKTNKGRWKPKGNEQARKEIFTAREGGGKCVNDFAGWSTYMMMNLRLVTVSLTRVPREVREGIRVTGEEVSVLVGEGRSAVASRCRHHAKRKKHHQGIEYHPSRSAKGKENPEHGLLRGKRKWSTRGRSVEGIGMVAPD